MSGSWRRAGVVAAIAAALAGCGGGGSATAHLQGKVTVNGQPLPADATGSVTFVPTQKDQARAVTAPIEGGQYDSPNTPLGAVKVSFSVIQPTGPEYTTDRGTKARNTKSLVAEKYAAGVDLNVTADNAGQDFDVGGD